MRRVSEEDRTPMVVRKGNQAGANEIQGIPLRKQKKAPKERNPGPVP